MLTDSGLTALHLHASMMATQVRDIYLSPAQCKWWISDMIVTGLKYKMAAYALSPSPVTFNVSTCSRILTQDVFCILNFLYCSCHAIPKQRDCDTSSFKGGRLRVVDRIMNGDVLSRSSLG
jgi:hypothetical protein